MIAWLYEALVKTKSDIAMCNLQYVDDKGSPIADGDRSHEYRIPDAVWTQDDFGNAMAERVRLPV